MRCRKEGLNPPVGNLRPVGLLEMPMEIAQSAALNLPGPQSQVPSPKGINTLIYKEAIEAARSELFLPTFSREMSFSSQVFATLAGVLLCSISPKPAIPNAWEKEKLISLQLANPIRCPPGLYFCVAVWKQESNRRAFLFAGVFSRFCWALFTSLNVTHTYSIFFLFPTYCWVLNIFCFSFLFLPVL